MKAGLSPLIPFYHQALLHAIYFPCENACVCYLVEFKISAKCLHLSVSLEMLQAQLCVCVCVGGVSVCGSMSLCLCVYVYV